MTEYDPITGFEKPPPFTPTASPVEPLPLDEWERHVAPQSHMVAALIAEVRRLREEIERLKAQPGRSVGVVARLGNAAAEAAEADAARLNRRVMELENGLKPFAEIGPEFSLSGGEPDPNYMIHLYDPNGVACIIVASYFRRARALLARDREGDPADAK